MLLTENLHLLEGQWELLFYVLPLKINTFSFLNASQNKWDKLYCSLELLMLLLTAMH